MATLPPPMTDQAPPQARAAVRLGRRVRVRLCAKSGPALWRARQAEQQNGAPGKRPTSFETHRNPAASPNSTVSRSPSGVRRTGGTTFLLLASFAAGLVLATASGCQWAANGQNAQGARLYQQGQYTAALQEFQKAISSDPQNADGYYNLAATTHRLGLQRQDPALISQAEALYNQCLDHDPNHVECHRGLAVLLVDTGRPDRAFALVKNWAAQNPGFAEARIELARLYEEAKEPQTALKYLEDAVQIDANNARAWLALGRLREQGGDLAQALQNYQRSYAVNPLQPMVSERIAAISRQISARYDASLSAGGTRLAQPLANPAARY